MQILVIRNYKKKLLIFGLITLLWLLMFFFSDFLAKRNFGINVIIDNYISFSYPVDFEIDEIFINEYLDNNKIETTFSLKKPVTKSFSTHESLKGKFKFEYPSAFKLTEKNFSGSEILYHIEFHDKSQTCHGFVQVWNMPDFLEDFLEKSKTAAQQNFEYFSSSKVSLKNNLQGFYWDYSILTSNNKTYKCNEVFFKKDSLMYRISYFTPRESWNASQEKTFWRIVDSFKLYKN